MKYCPHCKAEYQEKIDVCADCDAQLISQQEFEKRKEEEERFHQKRPVGSRIYGNGFPDIALVKFATC